MGYASSSSWNTASKIVTEKVNGYTALNRYVTHKKVGNCLWMVVLDADTGKPFIVLYLLSKSGDGWGYKDMSENMFPYYYSCPLEYFGMCEPECAEWRAEVRKWHARQAKIKRLKKNLENWRCCKPKGLQNSKRRSTILEAV